jgi:putative transcriptional regulator
MARRTKQQSLERLEANRDIWQEVLDGVREIKSGGGKRVVVTPDSPVAQIRQRSGLSQEEFAAALGVSKRTIEQWEQGRRKPSGAAKTLLKIVDRHPEVLLELAA